MESKLETGAILRLAAALAAAHPATALFVLLGMTATGVGLDLFPEQGVGLNFAILFLTLAAQYWVMRQVLAGAGLPVSDRGGVGKSFFGITIAVGLVSGMGLVLLIVPGVYLYTRWSLAVPIALSEGERMSESMGLSRDRTEGNMIPIAIALIVTNLPWVVALPAAFYFYPAEDAVPLPLSIAVNAGVYLSYVATWFCMIAAYIMLRPAHELEEVFA